MSFTRTLAKLAAGFAVAKGIQQFRRMGGMAGVQSAMKDNPSFSGMQSQMATMLERFGMAGSAGTAGRAATDAQAAAGRSDEAAAAGLGGLMAALGAAAATGTEQAARMMDALGGNSATTDGMEQNAKLMIRAMIQAAKADGEIGDEERARILAHLGDLDPAERSFVEAEMDKPVDVQGLAADTTEQMKAQVYAMSLMAVKVDATSERSYLDGLAAALGLSDETRERVHRSMGPDRAHGAGGRA